MVWTAEAFLKKRYEAGLAEGRAKIEAKVEMFLEEHPDATAAQLREFLINSRNPDRRNGASQ